MELQSLLSIIFFLQASAPSILSHPSERLPFFFENEQPPHPVSYHVNK